LSQARAGPPVSVATVIKTTRFDAPLSLKAASNFVIWPRLAGGCGPLFGLRGLIFLTHVTHPCAEPHSFNVINTLWGFDFL
jgi:hypothetical protein